MRKSCSRICALLVALSIVLSVPALANTYRASDQIDAYSVEAVATGGGAFETYFTVYGTGKMTSLGAESIVIREKSGNIWRIVKTYDRDDSGMTASNAYVHSATVYHNGTSGTEYMIEVTLFAENASGYDSRLKVVYVTA